MLIHVTNISRDIYLVINKNKIVFFNLQRNFRTNLSHTTRNAASQRYTKASQTDEQCEARNEIERNRNQEHRMLRLTPTKLHSIKTWKSITVLSKLLLLNQ